MRRHRNQSNLLENNTIFEFVPPGQIYGVCFSMLMVFGNNKIIMMGFLVCFCDVFFCWPCQKPILGTLNIFACGAKSNNKISNLKRLLSLL